MPGRPFLPYLRRYSFFLPRTRDEARGVLRCLSARARLVVTDEFPTFVVRDHTASFRSRSPAAVHLVDGNGILPMSFFEKEQYSAKFLRERAHRAFPEWWAPPPDESRAAAFRGELGFAPVRRTTRCDRSVGLLRRLGTDRLRGGKEQVSASRQRSLAG